ncbi:MAG: TonB-dependent receptor [Acidobacteria bacterium]|nr:TonB-dependent receptor [Acidobacteriota bacterium]
MPATSWCAVVAWLVLVVVPAELWAGEARPSLLAALRELQAEGLPVVFSSRVVTPDLVVEVAATSEDPRRRLDELLAPHGLTVREGPGGSLVVVPAAVRLRGAVRSRRGLLPLAGVDVRLLRAGDRLVESETTSDADGRFEIGPVPPGPMLLEARRPGFVVEQREILVRGRNRDREIDLVLTEAPVPEDQIDVTPSRVSLLQDSAAPAVALDHDDVLGLPHLGDDIFRALPLIPGVTATDVSAQPRIRGARRDETQVLLDGQELFEAYHLVDFDNALSIVAPATLDRVDLTLGGFPASFGDRAGAVLDMGTRSPSGPAHLRLGVSLLTLQLDGFGGLGADGGGWLVSLRRGSTDLAEKILKTDQPVYWDGFAKLALVPSPRQALRLHGLYAADRLEVVEIGRDGVKRYNNDYDRQYAWAAHQLTLGPRTLVETILSSSTVDQDRRATEIEDNFSFELRDRSDFDVLGVRQTWSHQLADGELEGGAELRRFQSGFDYRGKIDFEDPLAAIRPDGGHADRAFRQRTTSEHLGLHAGLRATVGPVVTLQPGLRFDRYTLTDEALLSPRLGVALRLGEATIGRLAWGRYYQSQRPYERQVGDGATEIFPAERSEHRVLGVEHRFRGPARLHLRVEAYERRTGNPRPRYENLFEGFNTFPELEPDRVLIEPEESLARGVEIFLRGRAGRRVDGWVSYANATTRDRIAGRWVPRQVEEREALSANLRFDLGARTSLDLAWRYHTGWPITPLTAEVLPGSAGEPSEDDPKLEVGEAEVVPVLGPLNSLRLPPYHRLDLRFRRSWVRPSGKRWEVYLDVQNLYGRRNVDGLDIQIEDDGTVRSQREETTGVFPSIGFRWEL